MGRYFNITRNRRCHPQILRNKIIQKAVRKKVDWNQNNTFKDINSKSVGSVYDRRTDGEYCSQNKTLEVKINKMCVKIVAALKAVLLFMFLDVTFGEKTDFPGDLLKCTKETNRIDVCLRRTLEELRRYMPTGIPELGLRPSEPLRIRNIR